MKTIILCGGRGIRLRNYTDYIPKGIVKIGYKPILWHIMKKYANAGFKDFILALGENGDMIRNYFINYELYTNDITITLGNSSQVKKITINQESDWQITFTDTGEHAYTGARINRCKQYIDDDTFMVTYSDCLCTVSIKRLLAFHKKSKKIATVTGVTPPYRYGEFIMDKNDNVVAFKEESKLQGAHGFVNGGYMVFNKKIFRYLNAFNECTLEKEVFINLARDKQIAVYKHEGFWQCLDTDREYKLLNELSEKNKTHWLFEGEA